MLSSPPAPVKTKDAPAPQALFRPPARLQTSRARFPFSGGTRVSDAPFVVRLSWGLSRWGRDLVRLRHQYTEPRPAVKGGEDFTASQTSRRPSNACDNVWASAYSRSPPEGSPRARRVTRNE